MVTARLLEHGFYMIRVELSYPNGGLAESKQQAYLETQRNQDIQFIGGMTSLQFIGGSP
jgi:hypothetical protein